MNLWIFVLWIHLLAAVAWIGGMIFLTLILVPVVRGIKDQKLRYELVRKVAIRFKYLGWTCIGILLITGVFNAFQRIASWEELLITGYGKTMILKLFLFSVIIIFSAFHDFYLGPKMVYKVNAQKKDVPKLRRVLVALARGNLLLGLIVIFLGISLRWNGIF